MADSLLTFTQMEAAFDNIAHSIRKVTTATGHSFITTPGLVNESTDSLVWGLRAFAETDIRAWTSDDAIARVSAAAHNALNYVYTDEGNIDGAIKILAPIYGPIIKGLMNHYANYQPQTTGYENFWKTWGTMWTADGATASEKCILGEVVLCMRYLGISVDPDYCVPPEGMKIGKIEGATGTATLTSLNVIDPLVFAGDYTAQLYVITRNESPAGISVSITSAKDEADGPQDTGATTFTATVASDAGAGSAVDLAQTDSHILQSVSGAAVTADAGWKEDDDVWINVKQFRASAY